MNIKFQLLFKNLFPIFIEDIFIQFIKHFKISDILIYNF